MVGEVINFFIAVSCIAASSSGLVWVFVEYKHSGKMSGLDFCCGAISGLAAITPGSGFVAPWAAMLVGVINGVLSNFGCHLKHWLGIDDALDTFGVHGVGGFYGNIVAGIFAQKWIAELDGMKIEGGWVEGNWMQVPYQLAGSFAGAGWSFIWTYIIVSIMQKTPLRLRMTQEEEEQGDLAEMGEMGVVHQHHHNQVITTALKQKQEAIVLAHISHNDKAHISQDKRPIAPNSANSYRPTGTSHKTQAFNDEDGFVFP